MDVSARGRARGRAASVLVTEADIASTCLVGGDDAQANLELMRLALRSLLIARDCCANTECDAAIAALEAKGLF